MIAAPLAWLASASGAASVLAGWLGLVNQAAETEDAARATLARVRWWSAVVLAILGVVLYAGALGIVLYELWGYIPWLRTFARWLTVPLRWLRGCVEWFGNLVAGDLVEKYRRGGA